MSIPTDKLANILTEYPYDNISIEDLEIIFADYKGVVEE